MQRGRKGTNAFVLTQPLRSVKTPRNERVTRHKRIASICTLYYGCSENAAILYSLHVYMYGPDGRQSDTVWYSVLTRSLCGGHANRMDIIADEITQHI